MKRVVISSRRINTDNYKLVDSGYAETPQVFERIKANALAKYSKMYSDVRVYRMATDTPGLIMYGVYVSDEKLGKIIKNISEGRYDGYYRITYSDGSEMLCEGYNLLPDDAKEWLNSHEHKAYDAFYGPLGDD